MYSKALKGLKQSSIALGNDYFQKKITEFPVFDLEGLQAYENKEERRVKGALFQALWFLYMLIRGLVKGERFFLIKDTQLGDAKEMSSNIIHVLKHPGLEEMIK